MSISNFVASDWVYVADSMGRIGQGYYENKDNPNQTITVDEFERRRTQPVVSSDEKEQIINIKSSPVSQDSPDATATQLTPWDNPVVGEETLKSDLSGQQAQKASEQQVQAEKASATPVATATSTKKKVEQIPKQEGSDRQTESVLADTNESENNANSKVICSELVRQGLMSTRARDVCRLYAARHLDGFFERGYHLWAVPCVQLMRRSVVFTRVIAFFTKYRTMEVAYRMDISPTRSFLGRLVCGVHDRLCTQVGRYVGATDYRILSRP